MNKKFKISVHLNPHTTLTYNVKNYEVTENGLIRFIDDKFNKVKIFDMRICEIEEVYLR